MEGAFQKKVGGAKCPFQFKVCVEVVKNNNINTRKTLNMLYLHGIHAKLLL